MEKIIIGCPIQNREKIVDEYLQHIYNLTYPKSCISLMFYVNNSTDLTELKLLDFKLQHDGEYMDIHVIHGSDLVNNYIDNQETRDDRDYAEFAKIRNRLLKHVKIKMDVFGINYFMSVDSDVLLKDKEIIQKLLECDVDMVSVPVHNATLKFPTIQGLSFEQYNCMYYDEGNDRYVSMSLGQEFNNGKMFEVYITMACFLIKKEPLWKTKYGNHEQGEDIPFCEVLRENGGRIYCQPNIYVKHLGSRVI